jgi:hypothetical protein
MSFVPELERSVRALTQLAAAGTSSLTRDELDIALSGRRAVIGLMSTVLDDVLGLPRIDGPVTLANVALHPVLGLSGALRQYPIPPTALGPLAAFMQEPQTTAGRAWRDLARHATLAQDHWTTGQPRDLDHTAAWTAVADVAAMASLLSEVDTDLLRTVKTLTGRTDTVLELERTTETGLGMIAREVARLADAGPLNDASPDRTPPETAARVLQVGDAHELVPAVRQVGILLRDAQHNSPDLMRRVVIGHARACAAFADVFQGVSDEHNQAAALLREHETRLTASVERCWPIATVDRPDKRAEHQITEVLSTLRMTKASEITAAVEPKAILAAIAATTRDMTAAVRRHLFRGQWLTPHSDSAPVRSRTWERYASWQRVNSHTTLPRQISRLLETRDHAALLAPPEEPPAGPPRRIAPGTSVNPTKQAPPTADAAAPRPPPGSTATVQGSTVSWRELARQRTTSRPTAPWQRPVIQASTNRRRWRR